MRLGGVFTVQSISEEVLGYYYCIHSNNKTNVVWAYEYFKCKLCYLQNCHHKMLSSKKLVVLTGMYYVLVLSQWPGKLINMYLLCSLKAKGPTIGMWYPDSWISKLFWLSIIQKLKKLKYPSIQVSMISMISKYPCIQVSGYTKNWDIQLSMYPNIG